MKIGELDITGKQGYVQNHVVAYIRSKRLRWAGNVFYSE